MLIDEFFRKRFVHYASYDNIRKISSYVDGLKNASRKVTYTILEKNIKSEIKVSQLGSKVAEFSEYLHGNLDGTIVGMAQNFTGSNNLPLLAREGNFGTRFISEASASRYIYTHGSDEFFALFSKDDTPNLTKQYFEGAEIEPLFYVPTLPLLLINGNEGVSSGFAQKILPRSTSKVIKALKTTLSGKTPSKTAFIPYYEGFKGEIVAGDNEGQWHIKGAFKRVSKTKLEITEIPVGLDLKDYISILNSLEEKKIIRAFDDKSEGDTFSFLVSVDSEFLNMDDDVILEKLKLIKKVTENYTAINEKNKIVLFGSDMDIYNSYVTIKLDYMKRRKEYLLDKIAKNIKINASKYIFINGIIKGDIIINNKPKADIIKQLESNDKILMLEDSYDYLLRMPLYSATKEKMLELKETIQSLKAELEELKARSIEEMWLSDIEAFEKLSKKK